MTDPNTTASTPPRTGEDVEVAVLPAACRGDEVQQQTRLYFDTDPHCVPVVAFCEVDRNEDRR